MYNIHGARSSSMKTAKQTTLSTTSLSAWMWKRQASTGTGLNPIITRKHKRLKDSRCAEISRVDASGNSEKQRVSSAGSSLVRSSRLRDSWVAVLRGEHFLVHPGKREARVRSCWHQNYLGNQAPMRSRIPRPHHTVEKPCSDIEGRWVTWSIETCRRRWLECKAHDEVRSAGAVFVALA